MTALCAIRGCRIRGRHETDCDGEGCAGCLPRATEDGHACDACVDRTRSRLVAIVALVPDARLVAAGLVRRGGSTGGQPGSRSPMNDGATDALDEVTNALTTIARDIAETRGLNIGIGRAGMLGDPCAEAASWVMDQLDWLRHARDEQGGPYAVDVFAEIADCASRMRSIVDGPGPKRYLGTCGATIAWDDEGNEVPREAPCAGDVEARPGAEDGRCKACGARWAVGPRSAWLDGEVRTRAFRASEIEDAYGVKANLIRQWATPERQLVRVHDRDFLGRARYLLGEVLDMAREQKLKAAERAAKRERLAAARAEEGATA